MSSRKRQRQATATAQDFAPEDHKTAQLCEQVGETLTLVLADCGDPVLGELAVVSVEPRRGAGRLVVTVSTDSPGRRAEHIIDKLERARGYLRYEVAQDISRKRVPELEVRVSPPAEPAPRLPAASLESTPPLAETGH